MYISANRRALSCSERFLANDAARAAAFHAGISRSPGRAGQPAGENCVEDFITNGFTAPRRASNPSAARQALTASATALPAPTPSRLDRPSAIFRREPASASSNAGLRAGTIATSTSWAADATAASFEARALTGIEKPYGR